MAGAVPERGTREEPQEAALGRRAEACLALTSDLSRRMPLSGPASLSVS